MAKRILSVLFFAGALVFAGRAQAVASPLIDFTDDASGFAWFGNSLGCEAGCTLGYTFDVTSGIVIDALGVYDSGSNGLTHSHDVGIWDSAGTLLASTTVGPASGIFEASASGDGRYVYGAIGALALGAGEYTIGAFYAVGTTDHVVHGATGIFSNSANAAYDSLAFINSGAFVRPTNLGGSDDRYFGPTARIGAVPEPVALLLFGVGFASAARRFRRRS